MRKLIGVTILLAGVIVILPAVLLGTALSTFGTILLVILVLIGLVFISN